MPKRGLRTSWATPPTTAPRAAIVSERRSDSWSRTVLVMSRAWTMTLGSVSAEATASTSQVRSRFSSVASQTSGAKLRRTRCASAAIASQGWPLPISSTALPTTSR